MANFFPCPNPACTYQFDADQLPAAAMVTCPICRTRFPYRAAEHGVSSSSTQVMQASGDSQSPLESRPPERMNRLINLRPVPKSSKAKTAMMLVGFTVVVLTVLTVISLSLRKKSFKEEDSGGPYIDQTFNFRWQIPPQPIWRQDKEGLREKFGLNGFLYKKQDKDADPEGWIGLRCLMLGGSSGVRGPRQGELEAEVQNMLKKFETLQKTDLQATVAKQTVKGYQFEARLKDASTGDIPVMGEAYWFDYKGIGYVMAMWAPKEKWESIHKELVGARDGFEFATIRETWVEKADSTIHHFVENGDYQLDDAFGKWERANSGTKFVADLSDVDEKATMFFKCTYPVDKSRRKDIIPEAKAMVLDFSEGGGSVQEVLKHLANKDAELKFEPLEKQLSKQPIPSSSASIGTFLATNSIDNTQNRYYAVSVLKINKHNVAVVGWCKYSDAELMDPYILGLVASLKPRSK